MKYIWVNPVVVEMYKAEEIDLNEYLEEQEFHVVQGNMAILDEVRKQFIDATHENKGIVLDTRCPLAIDQVKKNYDVTDFYIPDIYPILIRTAFYLYKNYIKDVDKDELHIMCPCKELSELGNRLSKGLKGITFYAWNEWMSKYPIPVAKKIGATPIPLGFFDNQGVKVEKLTGEEEILTQIPKYKGVSQDQVNIIEMLYCKGGCHNGNGV